MERFEYSIAREPAGDRYSSLIDTGLQYGDTLLLIVRKKLGLDQKGTDLLTKLQPYLIDMCEQSEWPGTRLFGATADVYRFRFNFGSAEIVKAAASRLYDWVQPNLPEDPCILRSNGTPWLVTISHERYACLELDDTEFDSFNSHAPRLAKSLRRA